MRSFPARKSRSASTGIPSVPPLSLLKNISFGKRGNGSPLKNVAEDFASVQ
jgi:hypothetical protein